MSLARPRPHQPRLSGFFLAVATAALGLVILLLMLHHGVNVWITVALGATGILLLAAWVIHVVLPYQRSIATLGTQGDYVTQLEQAFDATLRRLQEGDLVTDPALTRGLPAPLAHSLAGAHATTAALVQQIQGASVEVAEAGSTVQDKAGELASASTEHAAAVVELTATTEELARTAALIAGNAAAQAAAAANAEQAGEAGAAAVRGAVAGVEAVIGRIGVIASRTDDLASRSREIYRVLDLITEIAHETHILSLNAAIEAAAAGEHGRRFGVVAEEVRRLAQRSRESVDSVRAMLEEFSATLRATAVATEEGSKEGAKVLERAQAAALALEELRAALADTARAAREISLGTAQQRAASDQVALTLKEVSQVVQRTAETLTTFSATADRLGHLALSIQLLTQAFRTPSPRSLKHLAATWAADLAQRAGHWEAVDAHLGELVRSHPWIELAYLVDENAVMIACAAPPSAPRTPHEAGVKVGGSSADRPWFQAVLRDRRPVLTPLYESLLTGEMCFTIAIPVWGGEGRLVAVLGVDINARDWTRI